MFAQHVCRAGVARAAIKKCGFVGTIKRVSCVSMSTKVFRSAIKRRLFAFSFRSQRKNNQKSKRPVTPDCFAIVC